jgi:oxalyl-CoA decarboxylase
MSMAKGLLPEGHPQFVAAARSLALREADVVMLVGARLNWLLGHGEAPQWNLDAKFIQVDIEATEFDSNQPIAAPMVGDIGSVMDALIEHNRGQNHGSNAVARQAQHLLGAERSQDFAAAVGIGR